LKRLKIVRDDIDLILITHFHGDHFGGLPFLLLDAQFSRRTRPLLIAGPQGIEGRLTQLREALFENSSRTKPAFDLAVVALMPDETRTFGAVTVTPFPVVHGESGGPHLAYRLEAEGRVVTYSGDTEWTETLVPAARDADLFIAEAYYYDKIVKNHLSLKTLEAHLAQIKAKRLILTHMSEDMLGRLDTIAYTAASDGMIVEV
jgi:ribonuclease BN (tRNA processing enzyme)